MKPFLVQISQFYRPIGGGQEVYIANLMRVLAEAGWETKVIQPCRGEKSPEIAPVPRIPGVARFLPFFDDLQFGFFAAISQVSLLNRADVILCHYAVSAAFISRVPKWRRKMIVLSHGVEWNVDRMNLPDRICERNAQRLFGRVTTVANDTDYLRRMGLNATPGERLFSELAPHVWFIPNCVDTGQFSPGSTPIARPMDHPVILVPRQICEDRGIHLAIEAFSLFVERRPSVQLLVVGLPRVPQYFEYCRSLVKQYGLNNKVSFGPPVSNEAMVDLYRNADVTLIPTLRREGTSLSALESMACGTPVVTTDVAGLRDLPSCRALPTPVALADALDFVFNNRQAEADRQRQAVCRDFNFHKWGVAWMKAIGSLRDHNI